MTRSPKPGDRRISTHRQIMSGLGQRQRVLPSGSTWGARGSGSSRLRTPAASALAYRAPAFPELATFLPASGGAAGGRVGSTRSSSPRAACGCLTSAARSGGHCGTARRVHVIADAERRGMRATATGQASSSSRARAPSCSDGRARALGAGQADWGRSSATRARGLDRTRVAARARGTRRAASPGDAAGRRRRHRRPRPARGGPGKTR